MSPMFHGLLIQFLTFPSVYPCPVSSVRSAIEFAKSLDHIWLGKLNNHEIVNCKTERELFPDIAMYTG